jgi:bifunctional polynucleotide phosphatase/kinase
MELAWHNNIYRAFSLLPAVAEREVSPEECTFLTRIITSARLQPKLDLLPYVAFTSFQSNYEDPQKSEGFSDIVTIDWVFEGGEEEQRRWEMWHQIDGK